MNNSVYEDRNGWNASFFGGPEESRSLGRAPAWCLDGGWNRCLGPAIFRCGRDEMGAWIEKREVPVNVGWGNWAVSGKNLTRIRRQRRRPPRTRWKPSTSWDWTASAFNAVPEGFFGATY